MSRHAIPADAKTAKPPREGSARKPAEQVGERGAEAVLLPPQPIRAGTTGTTPIYGGAADPGGSQPQAPPLPRGGNQSDYLGRRLGAAPATPAAHGANPLPRRETLERLFGEPLHGLDVALGVAAPGGRPDARAAARGTRLEFSEAAPPLGVLAHEAAHALQARRGAGGPTDSRSTLEAEAHHAARSASGGGPLALRGRAPAAWLYDAPAGPRGAEALRAALNPAGDQGFSSTRTLSLLRENAAPADMARLRADYGAAFFPDLKRRLTDTTWGEARGYLGAQLTLAENIQTRTGILVSDQAGVFETLERWPDGDVLRMIEEAQGVPAPAAAPVAATTAPPGPAAATWASVQEALAGALDSEGQYRATQTLLGKAERARAARPPPPPGTPANVDAVSRQRVAYAYARIASAESAGRPRDAYLAIADLNAAQRAELRPRLDGGNWPRLGATIDRIRAIAGVADDASALEQALRGAGGGSGDISPAMLENAAGRAGALIAAARARLAALPPASSEERNRRTAELAALEQRFHEGSLVQSLYFASHETGGATPAALGAPAGQIAQFTINQVSNFSELLVFVRRIPATQRLTLTQSLWYQAKLTQVMGIHPSPAQQNLLLAALYEGHPELANTDFLRSQQALLDAYDIEQAWTANDTARTWTALSRMPDERRQALVKLLNTPPDPEHRQPEPPLAGVLRRLEAGRLEERMQAQRLRRGLNGEAAKLLLEDATALTVRDGKPALKIADPRAFIESVVRSPEAQAALRRGLVIRRQLQENPTLQVSPEDRALAERYDAAQQAAREIGEQSPELRLAFENVALGEPDIQGKGSGTLDPAQEADFMHYRLEERIAAVRTWGSKATTDILSWAGPTVDENAARFRVLYDQTRLRGIGRPELAQLADFYYRTMAALDAFAPANRAFASTAAQLVAAVTATVVVSAASGGSLGPVAVGALAAFVGGASAGLTGAVIRGQSTDAEVLTDVATGAVEGAVSVAGSALAARAVHGATAGRAAGQAARMAGGQAVRAATGGTGAAVAEAIIDGAIGGAAGELFQTSIDEATWDRGVAAAIAALMAALARGAAFGAGGGLIGGLAGAGLGAAWRRLAGTEGQQAVREVMGAFDHIALGQSDRLAGLSEAQVEAVFRARRLALAGDDAAAAALLRRLEVVPEGKSAELIEAFRARRKLVEKAAAEMGTPIDDPGLAQRLGLGGVMVDPNLPQGAAQVRYAVGLDGVGKLELWVGRGTRLGDVTIHQETVAALRRWGEDTANLRGMLERVRAWARGGTLSNEEEVILELQKHARMIEARERAISGLTPGSDTARRLEDEVAHLQSAADGLQARLAGFGVPQGVIAGYGDRNPYESKSQGDLERLLDNSGTFQRQQHSTSGNPISEPGFSRGQSIDRGRRGAYYTGQLGTSTFPDIYGRDLQAGVNLSMEIKTPGPTDTVSTYFTQRHISQNILTQHGGRLEHLPAGTAQYLVVDLRFCGQPIPEALNQLSRTLRNYPGGDARRLWSGVRFLTGRLDGSPPALSAVLQIP